jgi:hypothetical protein
MQNACKEVALGLGAADIEDACLLELVIKELQDAITRVVVQRVESFVNHIISISGTRRPPGFVHGLPTQVVYVQFSHGIDVQ